MPGLGDLDAQVAAAVVRAWQVSPGTQTARWVVTLPAGVAPTGLIGLGATVTPVPYWANSYLAEFPQPRDVAGFPSALAGAGGAAWYYPLIARQQTPRLTNDPQVTSQWHLKNTGQGGGTVGADANVEPVWNAGHQRHRVARIAIVDDGLLRTHQDLAAELRRGQQLRLQRQRPRPVPGARVRHPRHGRGRRGGGPGEQRLGVAGAAYEASLAGIRLIAGPFDDLKEAARPRYHRERGRHLHEQLGPGRQRHPGTARGPAVLTAFANNFRPAGTGRGRSTPGRPGTGWSATTTSTTTGTPTPGT